MKKEEILKILKENKIKPSIHRIEILSYVIENKIHPSADEIYSALNSKIPSLSKATIYNTLKLLCKKKILIEILIEKDETRFDYIVKSHYHFKCKKCKRIYDIFKKCPILNYKKIDGHIIEEFHMYLIGVCKNCLNKNG